MLRTEYTTVRMCSLLAFFILLSPLFLFAVWEIAVLRDKYFSFTIWQSETAWDTLEK